MIIRTIVDEDFVQYKEPCMYIATAFCSGKCCKEAGIPLSVCLNDAWRGTATIAMVDEGIIERYISNSITKAIRCTTLLQSSVKSISVMIQF